MRVKSRRPGREAALRALYAMEIGGFPKSSALRTLREHAELEPAQLEYAERLVEGVVDEIEGIDDQVGSKLVGWTMDRLATLDRNILRLATYELFFCPEVPPAVSLDEAIELAKRYGTAESGKFVNGVLAAVLVESPKAAWDRESAAPETELEEPAPAEPEEEAEIIAGDSPEAEELARVGKWTVRAEPPEA